MPLDPIFKELLPDLKFQQKGGEVILTPESVDQMQLWVLGVVRLIVKDINILRNLHSLSPRTRAQVRSALKTAIDEVNAQNWT